MCPRPTQLKLTKWRKEEADVSLTPKPGPESPLGWETWGFSREKALLEGGRRQISSQGTEWLAKVSWASPFGNGVGSSRCD